MGSRGPPRQLCVDAHARTGLQEGFPLRPRRHLLQALIELLLHTKRHPGSSRVALFFLHAPIVISTTVLFICFTEGEICITTIL